MWCAIAVAAWIFTLFKELKYYLIKFDRLFMKWLDLFYRHLWLPYAALVRKHEIDSGVSLLQVFLSFEHVFPILDLTILDESENDI